MKRKGEYVSQRDKKCRLNSTRKRKHENSIVECLVEHMQANKLFLTKNCFHIFYLKTSEFVSIKDFISRYLVERALVDPNNYLQVLCIAKELKSFPTIPKTPLQTFKYFLVY